MQSDLLHTWALQNTTDLLMLYEKNSVTIATDPFNVMMFLLAVAVAAWFQAPTPCTNAFTSEQMQRCSV